MLTETTTKLHSVPQLSGVHHGHTGHVRFLTSVQMGAAGSEERGVAESKERGVVPPTEGETTQKGENLNDDKGCISGRVLVISGGDGYEDFSSSSTSDLAGREDSTNHLLLWSV
ncbi:rho guanine nucleotide exchange factor 17 isoform X1 [Eurytemora carolleeae]|uniref:rho guanine nucleotide exchange factor 17 isoform X1 n=1 Tax=Eurytemora carolleeae TaxID=1294199 RepID=UPI000C75694F|nr:rho guanine nucleotide exchange factor 17 isoform X1 [Eurytemora carolleeae]|eukprot:XP_023326250.1 rho guanine nucleotide exchange factor 17-like isoform X1 [Eurytemora affinis]